MILFLPVVLYVIRYRHQFAVKCDLLGSRVQLVVAIRALRFDHAAN